MFSLILHLLHRLRLLPSSCSLQFHPYQDETSETMDSRRSYSQTVRDGPGHSNGQSRLPLQHSTASVDPGCMETDRKQLTIPLEPQPLDLGTREVVEVEMIMDNPDEPHPSYPGIPQLDFSKDADVRAHLEPSLKQNRHSTLDCEYMQTKYFELMNKNKELQNNKRQVEEQLEAMMDFNMKLQKKNSAIKDRMREVLYENRANQQELETVREHIMRMQYSVERLLPESVCQVFVDMRLYLREIFEDFTENITLSQIFEAMRNSKYDSQDIFWDSLITITGRNPNLETLQKSLNDLPADFFLALFMFILWDRFFEADPLYEVDLNITVGIIRARDGMLKTLNLSPEQIRTWTCQAFRSLLHTVETKEARCSYINEFNRFFELIPKIVSKSGLTPKRLSQANLESIINSLFDKVVIPACKLRESMLTSSYEYLVEFHVFPHNQEDAVKLMEDLARDKAAEFFDVARNGRKIKDVKQCWPLCTQIPVVTLIERKNSTQVERVQVVMKGVVYVESGERKWSRYGNRDGGAAGNG